MNTRPLEVIVARDNFDETSAEKFPNTLEQAEAAVSAISVISHE
jgi:hypothetical protein